MTMTTLTRVARAISFAKELRTRFQGDLAQTTREAAATGNEHKELSKVIGALAKEFAGPDAVFDWEGRNRGREPQRRSYPLLGTWTHPDAAVTEPFTLAIEFDREPADSNDTAHFKACLMKAACHVQSRAYDASLLVFTLQRPNSTSATYLRDPSADPAHTRELLRSLRAAGLFYAFVPPV